MCILFYHRVAVRYIVFVFVMVVLRIPPKHVYNIIPQKTDPPLGIYYFYIS